MSADVPRSRSRSPIRSGSGSGPLVPSSLVPPSAARKFSPAEVHAKCKQFIREQGGVKSVPKWESFHHALLEIGAELGADLGATRTRAPPAPPPTAASDASTLIRIMKETKDELHKIPEFIDTALTFMTAKRILDYLEQHRDNLTLKQRQRLSRIAGDPGIVGTDPTGKQMKNNTSL